MKTLGDASCHIHLKEDLIALFKFNADVHMIRTNPHEALSFIKVTHMVGIKAKPLRS